MRKLFLITVASALLVGIAAVPIPALGEVAEKATGYIEYYQAGYFFDFNAHADTERREAKGQARNYTPDGGWYRAEVRCVNVIDDDTVLFAAELMETNRSAWGPWVLVKVYDGGTPGSAGDQIWGKFMSGALANSKCESGDTPTGGPWPVLSGNLVVHTYE